jgi:hypothetical protein
MYDQPFEPRQFVSELRSGLRIAVGQVNAGDENTTNSRFHVPSLMVVIITRKLCASQKRLLFTGKNCHTVPGAFTHPDRFISGGPQSVDWKVMLLGLEFLETDHFGLLPFEPTHDICKPLVDVVDVECRDLHAILASPSSRGIFTAGSSPGSQRLPTLFSTSRQCAGTRRDTAPCRIPSLRLVWSPEKTVGLGATGTMYHSACWSECPTAAPETSPRRPERLARLECLRHGVRSARPFKLKSLLS